jgi:L-ascorbate metabolism protein UlaG (beta-lactamase superfamily)
MQIIYHGHSFIEIETEQGSILIDPFVTGNSKCDISLEDVFSKKITHILLTHGHHDHVGDTIEIAKNIPDCMVVGMVKLIDWLETKGIINVHSLNIWWRYQADSFSLKMVRADHSNSNPDEWYAWLAAGLVITIWDKVIYHAGDTAYFSEMKDLADENINVAFLPIGDTYTMGVDDAVKAAGLIHSKILVPIHYNTFPTIKADDMHFAQQIMLKQYGVPKVLRAGQYVVL